MALVVAGCSAPVSAPFDTGGETTPTGSLTNPTLTMEVDLETATPKVSPIKIVSPTPTVFAIQNCPPREEACDLNGHFWLRVPIKDGNTSSSDGYRFGSTQNGTRETHHGVEFEDASGTKVVSAADGEVIFAGADTSVSLAWVPNFYGNVIVVQHELAGFPHPIYTLYGHLSVISVTVGDEVNLGEQIGEVGATGTALGSHLHFEVRIGKNAYDMVMNPLLWVLPEDESGVVAGAVMRTDGTFSKAVINVQKVIDGTLNANSVTSITTYENEQLPVSEDIFFHENFATGNLSAGMYRLSFVYNGKVIEKIIEVKSKRLTYVNFIVE